MASVIASGTLSPLAALALALLAGGSGSWSVVVVLYYFDRSFMVCYTLPNLFTGHIVHDQLLPVTTGKIVHSQVQKSH